MEDVVAVEVQLVDGGLRYFITWGRIQDAVDSELLAALVIAQSQRFALGGIAHRARLCGSLHEAADSNAAPYFYESLLRFANQVIPFGPGYEQWRAARMEAMAAGKEISYCGNPDPVSGQGSI